MSKGDFREELKLYAVDHRGEPFALILAKDPMAAVRNSAPMIKLLADRHADNDHTPPKIDLQEEMKRMVARKPTTAEGLRWAAEARQWSGGVALAAIPL
ncbi:hypothetical protein [Telmatospirillum sp. J64-1]|uniref:hypothetical protein n=1 Tax=Telmatospirillum sp. J64-1 TaxID=2502183 RepID=UPI00115DAA8D|nr:hypothetical protein [Telmatospirillum sp. J64-1]